MTTKEQERKALGEIRKIVAELGEGSYIGTAFEGCFEIAEDNIKNDFGCSMKNRAEDAELRVSFCEAEISELKGKLAEYREETDIKDTKIENLEARVAHLEKRRDELLKQVEEGADTAVQNWNKFREQQDRADMAEAEIVRLKAKLYDLLVKD